MDHLLTRARTVSTPMRTGGYTSFPSRMLRPHPEARTSTTQSELSAKTQLNRPEPSVLRKHQRLKNYSPPPQLGALDLPTNVPFVKT